MALFSDIDWVILLAIGAFLLFGRDNSQVLRTLGRWYGRAGRLKQEILEEFSRAADLPSPTPGQPFSIRGALLGLDPPATVRSGIPAAVRLPPGLPPAPAPAPPEPASPWTGGYPTPVWSSTVHAGGWDREVRP
ncbi:MAG TPA: hypothetical protein VMG99_02850 [Thermoplasmata archaeon]|jgi:hypothetical protein|nr:hypothetical protein [Thermoplasmata archaeon]